MATKRYIIIKDEYNSNSALQAIASDVVPCITFDADETTLNQLSPAVDADRIAAVDSAHTTVLPTEARKK